jgi:hypothetical protein
MGAQILAIWSGISGCSMLLFASQTAPGGPAVILPALLITGLLVAASQAFVPKSDANDWVLFPRSFFTSGLVLPQPLLLCHRWPVHTVNGAMQNPW